MRIGVFTLRDLTIPSGSLVRIVGVTRHLRALGCEVTLFAPNVAPELEGCVRFVPLEGAAARHSLSMFYAGLPSLLSGLRLLPHDAALAEALEREKPDLLHCHQHEAGFRLLKIQARLTTPVVFELHGILRMQQEDLRASHGFPFSVGLLLRAERHLFQRTDALFVRTKREQQYVHETFGVQTTRIYVVPDGADVEHVGGPVPLDRQVEIRQQLGVMNKRVILFAGWFKLQSGLMDLVRAFHRIRSVRHELALVLIGDGALMPDVRRYVADHHVPDVVLTGLMPHPVFRDYQQIADVVVTPESRTPFNGLGAPLKLFECLASGRPTVATNVSSHTEIVIDGYNGFLAEADDPEALALGLARALDAADAFMIGARGRCTMVEHNSWKRSSRIAVDAYARVLARSQNRAVAQDQ